MRFLRPALCFCACIIIATPLSSETNQLSAEVTPSPTDAALKPVPAESVDLKEVVVPPPSETPVDLRENKQDNPQLVTTGEPQIQPDVVDDRSEGEVPEVIAVSPEPVPVATAPPAVDPIVLQEDLVLLNSVVGPGMAARLSWQPDSAFSGISSPTPVLVVNGTKPGPRLCLTAAVHGDEINGIEIVRHILYNLNPEKLAGSVVGVPIVNLQGFRRSSRYLSDRRDLNRYFPGRQSGSSAARMAYSFFTNVVSQCDLLVDLHTGSFRRTNMPQLRADLSYPEVTELTERMGAIVVLQSKGHPGSLRRAATEAGIPAVTMELGQPLQLQKDMIKQGIKSVDNLIDSLGMEKRLGFFALKPEPVYYQSQWLRASHGGILFSEVKLGDRVAEGTLLGAVTDPITNARYEIRAPFAGRVLGMALNQVMYPGFAAYHVGLAAPPEQVAEVEPPVGETIEDGNETPDYQEGIKEEDVLPEADDGDDQELDPRMREDS